MKTVTLTDEQWQKILRVLRSCSNLYVGQEGECRRFLQAVLWMARSGAQWRLLPREYGAWNTVYKRFARWSAQGVFKELHQVLADEPDMEHLLIDSTVIRAHPCAAGAPKKSMAGKATKR